MALCKKVVDWVDTRLGVRALFAENMSAYLLPKNINIWYSLGATLLALLTLQIVTGLLLLVFYIPDTEKAFHSVETIMNEIPYGWLIRYCHAVGSNIVILAMLLHLLSVLFMGSYKKPRELTWLAGFFLYNVALISCLTGYLLPWSQLSFWATTVATSAAGAIPAIGDTLVRFLRGGELVGAPTLGRFFALHVMGLPLLLGAGIGLHLFCVRRLGVSRPPFGPDYQPAPAPAAFRHETHPGGIPFFPTFTIKEIGVVSLFFALLAAVLLFAPSLFIPPAAFEPADPFLTPEHIKPEWYFLWAYQTLKIFPSELAGLLAQGGFMTLLALIPFIDRGPERRPGKRPLFLTCYFLGIVLIIGLSIWGHYS